MPFEIDLDALMDRRHKVAPTIDPSKAWLHVTDMQITCTDPSASCFLPGGAGVPSGDECVTVSNDIIRRCRSLGIPISWSMFGIEDDFSDAGLFETKVHFYVAGAGPVGLAAAHSAQLLGAAVVIVGDLIPERLEQARSFGCETIDVSKGDPKNQIALLLGEERAAGISPPRAIPEVDAGVDAVGFEARGHGEHAAEEVPATVLNSLMDLTRAGGALGIPGLYVTGDPGAQDEAAQRGSLSIRIGLGWAKSHSFATGQCPVMKYHRELMMAILEDRCAIAKAVNATVIALDDAPQGYENFDGGAAVKYVLDPNGLIPQA